MKLVWPDDEIADRHYRIDIAEKYGEKVRKSLLNYLKEGPVIAIVIEGVSSINTVRKIVGSTYPSEAPVGTIRGDFTHVSKEYANSKGIDVRNLVHASSDKKDAETEIPLWFSKEEIHSYEGVSDKHLF